ncbi:MULTISPECIES: cytochrome b [Pseudomonas syringae group]|uniref:cytochrome b n=1 Tax=Pseudomonas syringae group TaxID=136849 RepID=UPI0009C109D7|nr:MULTISPECIES: cytochrome b [Pseudomonas syringae group]MBD8187112.1 cytochrome b [Pseudomonas viridiflava]MBD8203211.1 cytochrome b [Pseudomonas viridiflava]MDY0935464.1 cytochrome b [Pseudomonas viridiflava]MDY1011644.1 cytochrome b [Pseudomonas viridiflava]QXG34779.1 cytochrome b [Pseudomonas viridiflava]
MHATTSQRYTSKARWLHWVMAALIVLAYTLILSRSQFGKGSEYRLLVVQSHFWVGLLILTLAFFRVAERRRHRPPGITPPLEGALRVAATVSHYALYAFLFIQPVLGLLTVMVEKGALPVPLTDLQIPWPFATSDRTAEYFEDLHKLLGSIFYYVIALHVVAAIWHHLVRKDNTLKRMV